jgi:hypothetical protein
MKPVSRRENQRAYWDSRQPLVYVGGVAVRSVSERSPNEEYRINVANQSLAGLARVVYDQL